MLNRVRQSWIIGIAIFAAAALAVLVSGEIGAFRHVAYADPAGIKYTGAGSCAASKCHGAPAHKPEYDGDCGHNENTIWSGKDDLHSKAFTGENGKRGLMNKESRAIAKNLNIADAAKSERCLSCHALTGIATQTGVSRILLKPEEIAPKGYAIEDGISCDGCHGPAAKYLEPHTGKLWTQNQRKTLGSQKLYDEWGLFDTKNLKFRGNTCISCHLKIDPQLIQAGHPELPFELDSFSQGDWVHWRDKGAWFSSRAWAMGQVVSLREAALQLAERLQAKAGGGLVTDSYKQFIAHALLARRAAPHADTAALAALDEQIAVAHKSWDEPAKAAEALRALAKAADALADKLEAATFNQAITETLLKDVAAEGETAGALGFRAAEQYTMSLKSLWSTMAKDAKPADEKAKMDKIDALYEPLADAATYDSKKYVAAAKEMKNLFPGGAALPLPAGGPPPGAAPAADGTACPECSAKWPAGQRYCDKCGHKLP